MVIPHKLISAAKALLENYDQGRIEIWWTPADGIADPGNVGNLDYLREGVAEAEGLRLHGRKVKP